MSEMILALPDPEDEPPRADEESTSSADPARADAASSQAGPTGGPEPHGRHAQQQHKRSAKFGTIDDCLAALQQLPGLLALGLISSQQANSMRAILGDLLRHYTGQSGGREPKRQVDINLLNRLRDEPELANWLEPFLSDEQVAWLMQEREGPGE